MSFKAFLLILFILVCGTFVYIKVQLNGSPDSAFNQSTRYSLGKSPMLRKLFGLHSDGDARKEYLSGTSAIVIEVVQSSAGVLTDNVIEKFAEKVTQYTGRPTKVYNVDTIKSYKLSEIDLENIERDFHRHVLPGQPNLFIVYADDYGIDPKEVATTYKEFGIVVSDAKLNLLTQNYPEVKTPYIISSLLHEFGHQLGMTHIDNNNCIMSPNFHAPDRAVIFSGQQIPTDFCQQELDQLQNIKNSLQ